MKGRAHVSPFTALSFPNLKKEPMYCWVDRESFPVVEAKSQSHNYGSHTVLQIIRGLGIISHISPQKCILWPIIRTISLFHRSVGWNFAGDEALFKPTWWFNIAKALHNMITNTDHPKMAEILLERMLKLQAIIYLCPSIYSFIQIFIYLFKKLHVTSSIYT